MAKIIYRLQETLNWKQLSEYPADLTLQQMYDRMVDPEGDCGFVGTIMDDIFGSPGVIVEAWESEVVSFEGGEFLTIRVVWDYFHDRRFPSRVAKIRIMEGEL